MIHTSHNCIIFTHDPSLIGMLIMSGHQVHYAYDLPHMIQYVSTSSPDAILMDLRNSSIIIEDLMIVRNASSNILICGDNIPTLSEEDKKHIYLMPSQATNTDITKKMEEINNPCKEGNPNDTNILLIEDNNDIREMYALSFKSKGYAIHEANDGLAGIAKAGEIKPGIIILDIMMPQMDGFEVLHALRNNASMRPIIIVNSNLEGVDEENRVKELGADYFLRKSQYTPLEVVEFIEKNVLTTPLIQN